jgi:diaminohydroxyphosphoribosylaminopyrimidine deaminase/5-amino-6-(5-phosphoribosylamino)uracil reductase
MRAENMAIMVGTRTALLDNPRLNNTRWAGRNPIRVVTDRHGVLPSDSRLFSPDTPTIVYRDNTNFDFILHDLAQKGIHSLLVEGGTTLINHILQSGLYDEIHVEVSPIIIGDGAPAPDVSHLPLTEIGTTEGHQLLEMKRQ